MNENSYCDRFADLLTLRQEDLKSHRAYRFRVTFEDMPYLCRNSGRPKQPDFSAS